MVKVFSDLVSGDEMISDSYPHTLVNEETTMEVKAKYVTKGSDSIAIASDDVVEDDEQGETVVDLVDRFELQEMQLSKKEVMTWAKAYLTEITNKLKETNPDRVTPFKKGTTASLKLILSKFDEFQIFCGKSYNMEGALTFAYQKEQDDEGPTFLFFVDGMKGEKF